MQLVTISLQTPVNTSNSYLLLFKGKKKQIVQNINCVIII